MRIEEVVSSWDTLRRGKQVIFIEKKGRVPRIELDIYFV